MHSDVNTGTYDRNRRFPVEKGTRYGNACIYFSGRDEERELAETKARKDAIEAWVERWGPIPWDLVQIVTTHVTCQVIVDVRVEPL